MLTCQSNIFEQRRLHDVSEPFRQDTSGCNAFLVYVVLPPDREFLLKLSQFDISASHVLKIVT